MCFRFCFRCFLVLLILVFYGFKDDSGGVFGWALQRVRVVLLVCYWVWNVSNIN